MPTFAYAAKVVHGKVFLVSTTKSGERLGPFERVGPGSYTCEILGEGIRYLTRAPDGSWTYNWNYIRTAPQPVDGKSLPHK